MKKILLSLCFAAAALGAQAAAPCTPVGLRCEHLETPLGIDAPAPRLGWRLDDSRSGALQRAYRVVVGRDSAAVAAGCGDVWDSGRTDSDGMLVRYAGPKLDPFTRYYWAVTVWDKDYARSSSGVAAFETGMMGAGNWQGCWISDHHDINHKPAPYFRKEFSVGKRVKSARAYVAAAGLYELHINGRKVGDHRLDPMYTRFDRRNLYVTYDVTRQLQDGANAVGILLGNGWYNHQSGAVWNFERAPWRNRPAFCFDLRIEYADGTHEVVKSDLDWRTSGGPLVFNSIYTSEHYDARLEQPGWSSPGFDDSAWGGVMYRGAPSQRVTAQQTVPIRNVTEYRPRSVRKLDERSYLYDFGQNMAGVTKLRLRGEAGTQLRLIHAERLREDGHADLSNIDVYFRPTDKDDLFQTDVVTLSGRDDEFMPRFNYKGFRYYSPGMGMYISSDPIGLAGGNPTLYGYVFDPNTQVDPFGLDCDKVNKARARQHKMLQDNKGFNISPTDWDAYPSIGRNGTFITDCKGALGYFGNFKKGDTITISSVKAAKIESDMGLNPGSLQNGFKIREVSGISSMNPRSPLEGNEYFLGGGQHLPGGAPEMVINSIPTTDNASVTTILTVLVK